MSERAPGVKGREAPDVGPDDGLELVVRDVGLDMGLDVDGSGSLSLSWSASEITVGARHMVQKNFREKNFSRLTLIVN